MGGDFGEKVGLGRDGPELDPPESTNPATGLVLIGPSCTPNLGPIGAPFRQPHNLILPEWGFEIRRPSGACSGPAEPTQTDFYVTIQYIVQFSTDSQLEQLFQLNSFIFHINITSFVQNYICN